MKELPCKREAIELLKQGVSRGDVSKMFKIPISTVCLWYDHEKELNPEVFKALPKKRFPREKINQTEARIVTLIFPFIKQPVSDRDWEKLQVSINKELAKMVE